MRIKNVRKSSFRTQEGGEFSVHLTYAKNDIPQQQTSIGYGADGRIATAGFTHQGEHKEFLYSYLPGTHLLHTLTHPNGLTLTQSYDNARDLPTQMDYTRADALVVQRAYTYDILGRPTARNLARYGTQTQDTFGYNTRSELTTAHVNSADYSYAYDAIGNRTAATEAGTRTAYTANKLNQYTAEGSFKPTFDADGNQTLMKTSTGTWNVTYKAPEGSKGDWTMREAGLPRRGERPMGWARINAKNRPVRFVNADETIVVECTYDTMGRRATKKVTTNGTLTEHRRFLYRGYLQIDSPPPHRRLTPAGQSRFAHCPTGLTAVGRLACWDLTKNICETYRTDARIDLAYTYTPYGEVSPAHSYDQPLRWSSEYHDVELGLHYYNYRHYNPAIGRWLGRDFYTGQPNSSPYIFVRNTPASLWDALGLLSPINNRDFSFDRTSCSLKLLLHINFQFVTEAIYKWRNWKTGTFAYTGSPWTEGRKNKYKSEILYQINQKWNAGYKARLVNNKGEACCPCKEECQGGIELTLAATESTWYTGTEILVTAPSHSDEPEKGHEFKEYRSEGGGGSILLAERTQNIGRVINHEIGHILGLHHPGYGNCEPNSPAEYAYKGKYIGKYDTDGATDLMGNGDNLRSFYFYLWENYLNGNLSSCAQRNGCTYSVENPE